MSMTTGDGHSPVPSQSQASHPLIEKARGSTVPIAELIGFRVDDITAGRAVASLHSGPQHANPMGTLYGGVLCDLTDPAMGMAFVSTLAPDESFTTMALSINFFRPVSTCPRQVILRRVGQWTNAHRRPARTRRSRGRTGQPGARQGRRSAG